MCLAVVQLTEAWEIDSCRRIFRCCHSRGAGDRGQCRQHRESSRSAVGFEMSRKSTLPKRLKPMLATLTDAPFDDPDWV